MRARESEKRLERHAAAFVSARSAASERRARWSSAGPARAALGWRLRRGAQLMMSGGGGKLLVWDPLNSVCDSFNLAMIGRIRNAKR